LPDLPTSVSLLLFLLLDNGCGRQSRMRPRVSPAASLSRGTLDMHSLRTLPLLLLAACAAGSAVTGDFEDFWAEFITAVAADDAAALGRLTRYPFMYEGEERDSTAFHDIHAGLFDAASRTCLAAAAPVPEEDRYAAFCGSILYIFARDDRGWHFAEFAADPEALYGVEEMNDTDPELGSWTMVGGRIAPRVPQQDRGLANADLAGTGLTIGASRVHAAAPLGCAEADVEFVLTPVEGLFHGGLPEPAPAAARVLGIEHARTLTMRVHCDAGVFDYHHVPGDTLLIALDNVIWKLAPDADATPTGAVRTLLAQHMAGDMHLTPDAIAPIRHSLSATLGTAVAEYLARPRTDEPPPINGDPFTDSQEYPDRFVFEGAEMADGRAIVRVVFSWGTRARPVDFLLVQEGARWLLDDIRYDDGTTFRELLGT
jgi:hypothetical protein